MIKKSTPATKKKSFSFSAQIHQSEACINQDCLKLAKDYPKAIAAADKKFDKVSKELKKLKATAKTTKKTGRGKTEKPNHTAGLETQLSAIKTEREALQAGYKKFKAGDKVWQQFEKSWEKQLKQSSKPKKAIAKFPSINKAVKKSKPAEPFSLGED